MGISFDYFTSIIAVTSPQVTLTMQELADTIEDECSTPWGMNYPVSALPGIAEIAGKFDKGGGKYSEIIVKLYSPWQVQFWGGSGVSKTEGGSLLGGLGDVPVKATGTAGDITLVSQPLDGTLVISGSGVTEQDKLDIADAVWADSDGATLLSQVKSILGLSHENVYIDQTFFDADHNLTSARVRTYSVAGSVGTGNDIVDTYIITAVGSGPGEFSTFKQVKQ